VKYPEISLEIADIFNEYGHLLNKLSKDKMKVIQAIKRCRTSDLGGHKLECDYVTLKSMRIILVVTGIALSVDLLLVKSGLQKEVRIFLIANTFMWFLLYLLN
jgi:hypothetical protein